MLKINLFKIRNQLRKINWLARFYRKYIIKLPFDFENFKDEDDVFIKNDFALSLLPNISKGLKISIITPVYKPNLEHFASMLKSVLAQTYVDWELILVDDFSEDEELTALLDNYAQNPKIIIYKRNNNGHISVASNDALKLATGDYVALLDHDDLLHKDALKAIIISILANPKANVFYSDENKINEEGGFEQSHFKPKWNPDLFYSHNYICHFSVFRKEILDIIGGFRIGVEGSQDYDLLLRVIKECKGKGIIHVPYILYHWRIAQGSTALSDSEKSYTDDAGLKALQNNFVGQPRVYIEKGLLSNTYKINWPIPRKPPLVSIIIPTKNAWRLVKQCLDSLYELTSYDAFEVLLVNNQSDDPESINYFNLLEAEGKIRLLNYNDKFNYSAINNYAVAQAKGEIIVLMNNDIEILNQNWLAEMVSHCLRGDIGCVGAKLYFPDKTSETFNKKSKVGAIQHAGVITGIGGVAGHSHKYFPKGHPGYFKRLQVTQNLSAVTAACIGVRKAVFEEVGGLDEKNLTIAFNDVDFCLKVQALGYRNLWSPYIEMIHHESISRGTEDTPEKQARFANEVNYMKKKWGQQLLNDPCYSQWLTLDREDFTSR